MHNFNLCNRNKKNVYFRVTRSLALCVCFVYPFVPFLLAIVLSVLIRLTNSDYPFGILKLFFLIHDLLSVCVTRVTRRVPHVVQEPATLSEHLSAP